MTQSLIHILQGFSSIFDLTPFQERPNHRNYPRRMTPEELTESSWRRVGEDIAKAAEDFGHGQKELPGESRR